MVTPKEARKIALLLDGAPYESGCTNDAVFALRDLASQVEALQAQSDELMAALYRLMNSDPEGSIANASEDDLCNASNDTEADPVVREQAAAILQARATIAKVKGTP